MSKSKICLKQTLLKLVPHFVKASLGHLLGTTVESQMKQIILVFFSKNVQQCIFAFSHIYIIIISTIFQSQLSGLSGQNTLGFGHHGFNPTRSPFRQTLILEKFGFDKF